MSAATLRWPLFALLGLLIAIAVALLANHLVSERIGISSEPVSAGESLSPKHAHRERRHGHRRGPSAAPTQATPAGPSYSGTATDAGSSSGAGADDGGSDRSPSDDSKATGRLPSAKPPATSPAPAPATPNGDGSDTSTEPEPGDD
ncbi:MAG TPA: hypothetical protein VH329_02870 [Solirubrobacterales bacterium]|jgi:hypothetical protein